MEMRCVGAVRCGRLLIREGPCWRAHDAVNGSLGIQVTITCGRSLQGAAPRLAGCVMGAYVLVEK